MLRVFPQPASGENKHSLDVEGMFVTTFDSESEMGSQYSIHPLQAAQTIIVSVLICHSHLNKCQCMSA